MLCCFTVFEAVLKRFQRVSDGGAVPLEKSTFPIQKSLLYMSSHLALGYLWFLEPFFLVTVRLTVAQSQRPYSMLNLWVPQDCRLIGFFEDENGQELT